MQAVRVVDPGGPEVLTLAEVDDPAPQAGQLLIRTRATAVNRADLLQRRGTDSPLDGASDILGLECAGVVERIGPNTSDQWLGQAVMSLLPAGGYAQRAVVPERMAMPVPGGLSLEQAAAVPVAFLTAHVALFSEGELQPNQTVLIHVAAGGVGSAAVQLARAEGATVFATVETEEKRAFMEGLGAAAFTRSKAGFADHLAEQVKADVIIDCTAAYWPLNERVLNVGGRLVVTQALGSSVAPVDFEHLLRKRQSIRGVALRSLSWAEKIEVTQHFLRTRGAGFSDGRLKPTVDRVFDLQQVQDAHRYLEENQNIGKIVLRVP